LRASVQRAQAEVATALPAQIGPFEVIRRLGQGGMGQVFLCRRGHSEFDQLLAVKRLANTGDRLVGARLRLERQVLAALRHPHIAQFIDGGEDADGTPWVAMEYVDGEPIDCHADAHKLDWRARVRLFMQLVDAVQYAHRNLVVHRDLKPDNVMVNVHGQVKLLDFGIAKLLDERGGPDGPANPTMAGAMTPHYASPEQVRGEAVTQASDLYSLGVLLYELLAGDRPYRIESQRPAEVERIVCVSEPGPPSRRAGLRGAAARDLDAIVLKCLHKVPERRYGSAAQLGEDLQHWLRGQPVQARPDSAAYRIGSFVRRHPFGVATASVLALLITGFAAVMTWQAQLLASERDVAAREAQVAKETADFLIELFGSTDPRVSDPADLRARDLLDTAAERLPQALGSDPLARARLLHTIGLAYANMGEDERGTALLEQALELRQRHAGADRTEVVDSLNRLGNIHRRFGRLQQAEEMLLAALKWRARNQPVDADLADSYNNVGLLQSDLGHYQSAEENLRLAITLHRQVAGADAAQAASPLHNLAIVLRRLQRNDAALDTALEALALKRGGGSTAVSIANTLAILATIERQRGELESALNYSSESLSLRREAYGSNNPMIASGLLTHAGILAEQGQDDAAAELYDQAIALHRQAEQEDSLAAARAYLELGKFLHARGDQKALQWLQRAHAIADQRYPADSPARQPFVDALTDAETGLPYSSDAQATRRPEPRSGRHRVRAGRGG
jgi:serine/threonine-protein kinase